jgi:hypothetical protein
MCMCGFTTPRTYCAMILREGVFGCLSRYLSPCSGRWGLVWTGGMDGFAGASRRSVGTEEARGGRAALLSDCLARRSVRRIAQRGYKDLSDHRDGWSRCGGYIILELCYRKTDSISTRCFFFRPSLSITRSASLLRRYCALTLQCRAASAENGMYNV